MMFSRAFTDLMVLEGGNKFTNLDGDLPTKYGITAPVALKWNFNIENLTQEQAKAIYKHDYWDIMQLDDLVSLSYKLAFKLFQMAVNLGPAKTIIMLQRALNRLLASDGNSQIKVDGIFGNVTYQCCKKYAASQLNSVLIKMLNAFQCVRYIEIAELNPDKAKFLVGWVDKRIS